MKRLAVTLFILLLFPTLCCFINPAAFGGTAAASGSTYYVSPTGNDSYPGTNDKPWASPAFATRQLSSGDTLVIRGGRYSLSVYDDDILKPPSGSAQAWTTIKGEEGNRPTLAGKNNLSHAVDLSGKSYVRIENLEITSDNGADFREGISAVDGPLNNAVIKDLHIHHIDEFGIDIADTNQLQILDSDIEYCGFGSIGGPEGKSNGWQNARIQGCSLSYNGHYYQGGPGPGPYDRPDGFGIEPSDGPIEISATVAEHNRGDGLDSKASNTYINRCVVANNSCDGVKLWGTGSKVENTLIYGTGDGEGGASPWAGLVAGDDTHPNATFEFENVTIQDNPTRQAYPAYFQYDSSNPIKITMRNTIIDNGYGVVWFNDCVDLTFENNLVNRPGDQYQVRAKGKEYTRAELEAGALGTGNISKDPMFTSPAWGTDGDYRLKKESPAIDTGTAVGAPAIDLDGKIRPIGGGYDIGAYEYGESAREDWYLAEGCTAAGFETFVLIQNLSSADGSVAVTYHTPSGPIARDQEIYLPADSRVTLRVNDDQPDTSGISTQLSSTVSIEAERSVYWGNRIDGHSTTGVKTPSTTWYLAEGCTAHGFETWVLIQNPQEQQASVSITYHTPGGAVAKDPFPVGAGERYSLRVADDIGTSDVSTHIQSDRPVIAERAMYWGSRRGGHCSIGTPEGSRNWYFSEGSTAWGYNTYLLIQNPQNESASINVTYMTSSGPVERKAESIEGGTRKTIYVNSDVPNADTSIHVESDRKVVAERAMYWNNGTGTAGHCSIGATEPGNSVFMAEGSTAWGFETFLCLQNPNNYRIDVKVQYMDNEGVIIEKSYGISASSRLTVFVNDEIPPMDFSAEVTSLHQMMAERAMYWMGRGGGHASIGQMK